MQTSASRRRTPAFGLPMVCSLAMTALCGCSRTDTDRSPTKTGSPAAKAVLRVAAAADLKLAMAELSRAFSAEHAEIELQTAFGSSGNFFAQISNKAPFDLFLSADIDYPRRLIEQSLADRKSEFLYAIGHLVVWVPKSSTLDLQRDGLHALADASINKVALANPEFAPYGRAAIAGLKNLGVYEAVKDKLVLGENVAQAAQFVDSGAADAGLIALSLAIAPALRDKGRYWELPLDSYPRMEQGGVVLSYAVNRQAAETFRAFMIGPQGRQVLRRYGFLLPGE